MYQILSTDISGVLFASLIAASDFVFQASPALDLGLHSQKPQVPMPQKPRVETIMLDMAMDQDSWIVTSK